MTGEPNPDAPSGYPEPGEEGRGSPAEQVRDRALQVAGVVDLAAGLAGEIATYLPGRQVPGVRLREPDSVEVHVVVGPSIPLPTVAAELTRALHELGFIHIDIHIDDLREGPIGVPADEGEERAPWI